MDKKILKLCKNKKTDIKMECDNLLYLQPEDIKMNQIFTTSMSSKDNDREHINFYYFMEKLIKKITNNDENVLLNIESTLKCAVCFFIYHKNIDIPDKLQIFFGDSLNGYYLKIYQYKENSFYKHHLTHYTNGFKALYEFISNWYKIVLKKNIINNIKRQYIELWENSKSKFNLNLELFYDKYSVPEELLPFISKYTLLKLKLGVFSFLNHVNNITYFVFYLYSENEDDEFNYVNEYYTKNNYDFDNLKESNKIYLTFTIISHDYEDTTSISVHSQNNQELRFDNMDVLSQTSFIKIFTSIIL